MSDSNGNNPTNRPADSPAVPLNPSGDDLVRGGLFAELWEMLKLAAPTVATMVSYTAMQFVDGLMVSKIDPPDPAYVAAQGNGGVWAFLPISFVMGMIGVVNTYVSQNLGAGKPERAPAYAWNALWVSVGAYVFMLGYALVLPSIFAAGDSNKPARLLEMETQYAQILLVGSLLTMGTRSMAQFFYGLHRPAVVFVAAVCGNLVNVVGNWLLIYGRPELGIPAMGVAGAAIATVIGTGVECAVPMAVFLSRRYNEQYRTRAAWRPSLSHARDIVRIGWAPAVMFGNEMACWAIFMTMLAGSFGVEHNTAGWIVLRYMHLSFMPAVGLSFAITSVVGKAIGAGRPDVARHKAKLGVTLAAVYMTLCAAAFVIFKDSLVGVFVPETTAPEVAAKVIAIGTGILLIAAVFQLFDGIGIALIGALRGAGDTVVPGVATIFMAWTLIVGLGWLLTKLAPGLESRGPWIGAAVYIIVLGLFLLWRWNSGAWMRIKLLEHSAGAVTAEAAARGKVEGGGPHAA